MSDFKKIIDADYKDEQPLKTVDKIRKILGEFDIQTEELWNESGVPFCYSVRINIVGTVFGTNGKGLTREFALASGYGELMERIQLGNANAFGEFKSLLQMMCLFKSL